MTSRKWSKDHGQTIGRPRSSKYQLRQPVTQTVFREASSRARSNSSSASWVAGDLTALFATYQFDQLEDVRELELGHLDQRVVARPVRSGR